MGRNFHLNLGSHGIASIVIDQADEKVNTLSEATLFEFEQMIDDVVKNKSVKAIVIRSAKDGVFIAGADLKRIEQIFDDANAVAKLIHSGQEVFRKLARLPIPVIALIQGVCLGGGLELALACHYRIIVDHPKTQLGLPEVNLGIIPGWGGTQRLPRLIGLREGLSLVVSGKSVDAKKAYKLGIGDRIVASEFLDEQLPSIVESLISKPIQRKPKMSLWLEGNPLGRALLYWMTKKKILQTTKGFYPAPIAALELIKRTWKLPLEQGLLEEEKIFTSHLQKEFDSARHLIPVFLKMEQMKKQTIQAKNVIDVNSLGVIGAGAMGSGIAWVGTYNGLNVRMKDVNWEAVDKGICSIQGLYSDTVKRKKMNREQSNLAFHRLSWSIDNQGFYPCDLILEAATEDLSLKRKIFSELEAHVRPDAIIATNTSSLTVTELTQGLKHPERFVGLHFFNPPNRMQLVEVVKGEKTSVDAVASAVNFVKKLKKVPVIVGDCHGFLVNRIFAIQANEVMRLFEEGIPMEKLEKVLLDFGMPMGPFELADLVGNDVSFKAYKIFEKAYGERMHVPLILEKMVEKGWYGKKTGIGFYLYDGKKKRVNSQVLQLLDPKKRRNESLDDGEIRDRIILAMLAEAGRCLEEKVVASPRDLDIALILGIGFPPFRGGLWAYALTRDLGYMIEKMQRYEKVYGPRYHPSELLVKYEHQEERLAKVL